MEAEAAVAMEGVEEGEGLLHAHQLAGRGVARGVARGLRWGGGGVGVWWFGGRKNKLGPEVLSHSSLTCGLGTPFPFSVEP